MKGLVATLILLTVGQVTHAADLSWPDGTTWHDIGFVTWDTDTITLAHDGTQTRVRTISLPEETRLLVYQSQASAALPSFKNDPTYAKDFAEFQKQGVHYFGRWTQVLTKYSAVAESKGEGEWRGTQVYIVGTIPRDAVDGRAWNGWVWPAGRQRLPDVGGALHTVARYATSPELAQVMQRAAGEN